MILSIIGAYMWGCASIVSQKDRGHKHELFDEMHHRAVQIFTGRGTAGSGVLVAPDLVLTVNHVCYKSQGMHVVGWNEDEQEAVKWRSHWNPEVDLCLVELKKDVDHFIEVELAPERSDGRETVWVAGFPLARPFTLLKTEKIGSVQFEGPSFVFHGVTVTYDTDVLERYIRSGISGSGTYNNSGQLVGIVTMNSFQLDESYIVPINYIHEFIQKYKEGTTK